MSKVKTKGSPILFRPPIHVYDALVRICTTEGIHPNTYVERLLIRDIEAQIPKPRGRTAAKPYMGSIGGGDA